MYSFCTEICNCLEDFLGHLAFSDHTKSNWGEKIIFSYNLSIIFENSVSFFFKCIKLLPKRVCLKYYITWCNKYLLLFINC